MPEQVLDPGGETVAPALSLIVCSDKEGISASTTTKVNNNITKNNTPLFIEKIKEL